MPYREELCFIPGTFHAGPVGTLMEIAAGWSVTTLLPAGWGNATVDFSVKLLAPAIGSSFVAHGVALSAGKTLSVAEANVFAVESGVHTLCASGMVTVRNVRVVAANSSTS
jgi:acyl-coenzyme A thioesterase PaaI-like protein